MTIRNIRQAASQAVDFTGSVCVIGGGMAGLIAALRLARDKALKVVVVESGDERPNGVLSSLNYLDIGADAYDVAAVGRPRGLGGTSARWAGKLLPLSPSDARARPYITDASWPFDLAELEPYRAEVEALFDVDDQGTEEQSSGLFDPRGLLPRGDPDFVIRWPKQVRRSRLNLGEALRRRIARAENLEVWLGCSVVGFEFDPASARIRSISAASLEGACLSVAACAFVVAAGTLESTRLLLIADRQANGVISRRTEALGRYFNDHLGFEVATLEPRDKGLTNRMFGDRFFRSSWRHLHFELSPGAQARAGVASAYFDFDVQLTQEFAHTQLRDSARALAAGRPIGGVRKLASALRVAPRTAVATQWQYGRRQKYWTADSVKTLKVWIEQIPQAGNRLLLSDKLDPLGSPYLRMDWRKTELDGRTLQETLRCLRRLWDARFAHVCALARDQRSLDEAPPLSAGDAIDQAHPAGSTRMGSDPARSVVDADLRVHGVGNLWVASASTFPTSGSANPTLTIMQLAMRVADAVARSLQPG